MTKILDVSCLFSKRVQKVNNEFNDSVIFVETSNYVKDAEFCYKSISIVNIHSIDAIKYNLPVNTKIINSSNSKETFYYAQLYSQSNNTTVNVHLRKLNLKNLHDMEVNIIQVETQEQDEPTDYIALNSKIVGINERYCLFFVPQKKLQYGINYFSKCLLVDSFENKVFTVKAEFINGDSLLRLQDIWVINDSQNILIKTGRIQDFEKRKFWKKTIENDDNPKYIDQNESLVLLNTQLFISNVKNNESLTNIIIDSADFKSALSLCGYCGHKLTYNKKMFEEKQNIIITYMLNSGKFERKEVADSYEIICTPEKHYLIKTIKGDSTRFDVHDPTTNTTFQTTGSGIIAIDKEKIITYRYDEKFEQIVCIFNIHSGEIVNTYQKCNFDYDLERNLIIIF